MCTVNSIKVCALRLCCLCILLLVPSAVFAQPYVNSGDIFPDVWDNLDMAWENGNPSGYSEGMTAAMAVKINSNTTAQQKMDVCVQVVEVQQGNDYYAFTDFDHWDTTFSPTTFPDGSPVSFDSTVGTFKAKGATIDSVSAASLGQGFCDPNYYGVTVVFTKHAADVPAWFVYGGLLSQAGAATPTGSPDATVPDMRSSSFINGTFQSRIAGAGEKTINFKGALISLTPGILLNKTVTTSGGTCGVDDVETLSVPLGSTIKFCFVITNTGETPLLDVTLYDDTLSVDLTSSIVGLTNEDGDGLADDLALAGTATAEYLWVASADIDNLATATGSNQESTDLAVASIYFCGDGDVNPGEQCDDGNTDDGDGCSALCLNEYCGDGVTQSGLGEECDDGNTTDEDGCNSTCQDEYCGDDVLQTGLGEECDDGNTNNEDGCNDQCQDEYCGDDVIQYGLGEECDDGNTTAEDGCNEVCQDEYCGDDVLQEGLGEQCDDGNTDAGDGCNAQCQDEYCGDGVTQTGLGEECDDGNDIDTDACTNACLLAECGDGITGPGEECDDGNDIDTDACTNACTVAVCGDGITGPGEQCDDGNDIDTDECTNACTLADCGDGITGPGEECDDGNDIDTDSCTNACTVAECGDGITGPGEECDDGNDVDTDACTNACTVAVCGDGITGPGEECDDGNDIDTDACTNACTVAECGDGITGPGEECDDGNDIDTDSCTNACTVAECGDGITGPGEECDDGNDVDTDSCTNACTNAECGDGITGPGEQCDDGNTDAGDGCNAQCQTEYCGDEIVQEGLGEQCDDGNDVDGDGCNSQCQTEYCGDEVVQDGLGEQCDDGNTIDGDGCNAQCQTEYCGDGVTQEGLQEQCDDGNDVDGDGCNTRCEVEYCGDGIVQEGLGETCDDGNDIDDDECTNECTEPEINCSELDITNTQFLLDGGAKSQEHTVVKASKQAFRNARRTGSRRYVKSLRKKLKNLRAEAHDVQIQNWVLSWSIPSIITSCDVVTQFCIQTDNSPALDQYNENNETLYDLSLRAIKLLRRAAKKAGTLRAYKRKIRQLRAEAEQLRGDNRALSDSVPRVSVDCAI